ncbi:FecR family protein [Odoribacter sp. AF15-53]|uniref:FecR family protein n=1 Tax=Odoribacter sp. AF15-53 TaxID=2292236 RepID=UPI000E54361D|nr:FecR family protein [Odoribacter sp. AF15-53]RHR80815.1 DUF4974 domain-containing protein [Odoribacter sp. AF15-53]
MFENYSKVVVLLVKALQQELTVEEEEKVRAWREACEENEALYAKVMSFEFVKMKTEQRERANSDDAYMQVKKRCRRRLQVRRWRNVSVAAASILLFFGGWFYSETNLLSNFDNVMEKDSEIIVSGSKAELILSGGERMILGKGQLDSVWMHEGMEVHSTEDRVSYVGERPCGKEGQPVELQYNILRVPRGGEYSVVLGDGTLVCLNSESELRYPVRFDSEERKVFLRGEGFFEVTEDPEHPFVVEVENARIEVLGTTFNVCGYAAEERVVTTLVEGMVRLSSESQSVILVPNEQGVLDKDGHLTKVEVDVFPHVAWQKGQLVFRQQPLERVMQVVSRWYDVEVVFRSEKAKKISFTGNMRRYDDFEQIVRMLEKTGGLIFNIEGRTIYITEK